MIRSHSGDACLHYDRHHDDCYPITDQQNVQYQKSIRDIFVLLGERIECLLVTSRQFGFSRSLTNSKMPQNKSFRDYLSQKFPTIYIGNFPLLELIGLLQETQRQRDLLRDYHVLLASTTSEENRQSNDAMCLHNAKNRSLIPP